MPELYYLPCSADHLALIKPHPGGEAEKGYFLQPGFEYMLAHFSLTAFVGSTPVAAAGIVPIYAHRATAWAFLGVEAGPYLREITKKVRGALDLQPYKRMEMQVQYDFCAGHKWAKMLGFKVDAPRMEYSGIFGQDETLYVRIKK